MSDGKFNYKGRIPFIGLVLFHLTALFSRGNIFKCDFPRIYAAKSRYIPNGINTRHFNIIEKEKAKCRIGLTGEKYILFVCSGNLADPERKIKRYDIFLEIVALLNKDANEVWLPLTITNVPREEIVYYYNSADVLLVPSDVEGSPNVVKEALSCGLPVVGRDVGDIKFQLKNVPDCYIFSPDNLLAAVSHIKSLSNANKEARRTSWLAKGYSAEAVSKQIIHFYHERNPN